MKFTDGNWMMRQGVRAFYPAEAYDIRATEETLTVYAPTRSIRHRGDTLDGPLLTARLSSPLPDVIGVKWTHFEGVQERGPGFPVLAKRAEGVTVHTDEDAAELTSGRLSVRVARKGGWGLEFVAEGRTIITRSGSRATGYAEVAGEGPYLHEQLHLGVGECVYGLGERFTAFVKNGQVVEQWNKDGGKIRATTQGNAQSWRLLLVGIANVGIVEGGEVETGEHGVLVKPTIGSRSLTITLG